MHRALAAVELFDVIQRRGLRGNFAAPGPAERDQTGGARQARPRPQEQEGCDRRYSGRPLETCAGDRLVDVGDRAILITAFACSGRRRSEISALRVEQLVDEDPVPADPNAPGGDKLPCLSIRLGRTETTQADSDAFVLLVGRPVLVLKDWLERARISDRVVFGGIDHWGNLEARVLTPQAVNLILKRRTAEAGRSIRKPSPPTACAPAISPKSHAAVFRCPKPCSSRSIAPRSRPQTITMTRNARSRGRRG